MNWKRLCLWAIASASLIVVILFAIAHVNARRKSNLDFRVATARFVEDVNHLGASLMPGETATVNICATDADELVLLGCFVPRQDIAALFPNRPRSLLNELAALSPTEQNGPRAVWLCRGRVVSINKMRFTIGMNFSAHRWDLRQQMAVRIGKESSTLNTFYSVYFVDDKSKTK